MQLFSADALGFSKKKKKKNFGPEKVKKGAPKVAHNRPRPLYFTVQPRPTANSPELILHIEKSRDQRSVLLSVVIGSHNAYQQCLPSSSVQSYRINIAKAL